MTDRSLQREILSGLTAQAGNIVPVLSADLFLSGPSNREYTRCSGSADRRLERRFNELIEEGIVDWALETGRPAVIEDLDRVTGESKSTERNFILVPVSLKPRRNAVFALYTSKRKDEISERDLARLKDLLRNAKRDLSRTEQLEGAV